jgi:hypothetical protein
VLWPLLDSGGVCISVSAAWHAVSEVPVLYLYSKMPVISAPVFQGRPLVNAGSEEANGFPHQNDTSKRFPHQNKTVGFGQRPRPLHNRYTRTDNCVRWGMAVTHSRYKFVTDSLPKRFRNGRFNSETAVRRFQD